MYLRFNSISRFSVSAVCDRLVLPVPKTRLTFVRTSRRAVSVNLCSKNFVFLFVFFSPQSLKLSLQIISDFSESETEENGKWKKENRKNFVLIFFQSL